MWCPESATFSSKCSLCDFLALLLSIDVPLQAHYARYSKFRLLIQEAIQDPFFFVLSNMLRMFISQKWRQEQLNAPKVQELSISAMMAQQLADVLLTAGSFQSQLVRTNAKWFELRYCYHWALWLIDKNGSVWCTICGLSSSEKCWCDDSIDIGNSWRTLWNAIGLEIVNCKKIVTASGLCTELKTLVAHCKEHNQCLEDLMSHCR